MEFNNLYKKKSIYINLKLISLRELTDIIQFVYIFNLNFVKFIVQKTRNA